MTFSSNIGSLETLNPFVRCGFNPASAHMRPTLDGEIPMASAISARLQCVALAGVSSTIPARPPAELARRIASGDQGLKLCAVGGAKIKADVGASHVKCMTHTGTVGNLASGGEHWRTPKGAPSEETGLRRAGRICSVRT